MKELSSAPATPGTGAPRVATAGAPPSPLRIAVFLIAFLTMLSLAQVYLTSPAALDVESIPGRTRAAMSQLAGMTLQLCGYQMFVNGEYVHGHGVGLQVMAGCSGLYAIAVFGAAVVAFPAGIMQRACGLLVGSILILVVNVVRVVTLFLVQLHAPNAMRLVHQYLWPAAMVLIALAGFALWASWALRRPPRPSAGG